MPTAIDIHAHFYPQGWLDLVAQEGKASGAEVTITDSPRGRGPALKVGDVTTPPLIARFTDIDARLQAMDEQGVAVHVLSLSLPMVYWAERQLSQKLSAVYNDAAAAAHQRHPTRLFNLAMLPLQAPDLALLELERAASLPGVRGVYMATAVNEHELSHASLFPVYERIEALGLPIFLHPVGVIGHQRLVPHYLTNLLGNPFETAIAAAHLIFGGVLDRFPGLAIGLPHAGGAFPWLVGRLNRGWQKRQDLKHVQHAPVDYLRRFYYDTIGYNDDVLDYLVRVIGADRVLLGSDYCFPIAYERPVEIVTDHPALSAADKAAILECNARRLLKL
ncbi:MAG: amidohydrolase [Alphaproteobacteria bacterium]|nr:amidohydrolase [Alphaproteobacteria bacterium]